MKLLFDQNLSPGLARCLSQLFVDCSHVSFHGLDTASDAEVWEFARDHEFALVSKDSDFNDLSVLRGFPPKVVWLRVGNCTTAHIEPLLRHHHESIGHFLADPGAGVLVLL